MWFNRNGRGMRAHKMPGAISMTSPVGGGSGAGKVRELVSVLVSIGCIDLLLSLTPILAWIVLHCT